MSSHSLEELLDQTAKLHDHLCPKQVLGVRMGLYAGELLGLDLPQSDKRLLAFVESDGCFADGVSVATGCWLGHRTMRLMDYGKVAATFVDTVSRQSVRIHPATDVRERVKSWADGTESRWHGYLHGYQVMPVDELLVAQWVTPKFSIDELVSQSGLRAVCDVCGEEISNGREVQFDGRQMCFACAYGSYVNPGSE